MIGMAEPIKPPSVPVSLPVPEDDWPGDHPPQDLPTAQVALELSRPLPPLPGRPGSPVPATRADLMAQEQPDAQEGPGGQQGLEGEPGPSNSRGGASHT